MRRSGRTFKPMVRGSNPCAGTTDVSNRFAIRFKIDSCGSNRLSALAPQVVVVRGPGRAWHQSGPLDRIPSRDTEGQGARPGPAAARTEVGRAARR